MQLDASAPKTVAASLKFDENLFTPLPDEHLTLKSKHPRAIIKNLGARKIKEGSDNGISRHHTYLLAFRCTCLLVIRRVRESILKFNHPGRVIDNPGSLGSI